MPPDHASSDPPPLGPLGREVFGARQEQSPTDAARRAAPVQCAVAVGVAGAAGSVRSALVRGLSGGRPATGIEESLEELAESRSRNRT